MLDSTEVSIFTETLKGKNIVIDTSSLLLSGVNLLTAIPECNIIIPSIVVKELEEKRSHATVGFLAREWLRMLESLRVKYKTNLSTGVTLPGVENVRLRVEPNNSNQKNLPQHLQDGSNDSTILAVAKNLSKELGEENIVILSNDTPMRLHATLDLGIEAVEFNSTLAVGAKPWVGHLDLEISMDEYLDYEHTYTPRLSQKTCDIVEGFLPEYIPSHSHITLKVEGEHKPVCELLYQNGFVDSVPRKVKAHGITARNLEQDVAMSYLFESAETLPVVSLGGSAGTGKTLLSVAVGLDELKKGNYQKLVVFRGLHEMGAGQEMGFLPGDVGEKMEAWAGAVFDALDIIALSNLKTTAKGANRVTAAAEEAKKLKELIEVSPITYLRGRSLSNSYIVLEEAQNFSRNELLNIFSRVGENTKLVVTWDPFQVDNRFLQSGMKADIWSVINDLKDEDIFAHITLNNTERSRVAEISSRLLGSRQ